MGEYYVSNNVDENGRHEVHQEGCSNMPNEFYRTYIGQYCNDVEAVESCRKNFYPNCDGCYLCCMDGHLG